MSITDINPNPNRYYLGAICKRKHQWRDSGQTLRIIRPDKPNGDCIFCKRGYSEGIQNSLDDRRFIKDYTVFIGDRYRLGSLCKKNKEHEHESTGLSLRYSSSGECVLCLTGKTSLKPRDIPIQLGNGLYLGTICPQKHNHQNSGKSLRTRHGCVECDKERKLKKYSKRKPKPEDTIRLSSTFLLGTLCGRKHDFNSTGKSLRYNASTSNRVAGDCVQCSKLARKRRTHRMRSGHSFFYSLEHLQQRFDDFGGFCAYCQKRKANTIDHFIPISRGGSDVIGNLIPACSRCNFSKNCKDPFDWFSVQVFFSAKQWARILGVLGKTSKNYSQIPLF